MNPTNIVSAYQGINAIYNKPNCRRDLLDLKLKDYEANTLKEFCNKLREPKNLIKIFDGYYVGYTIKQISKEFDLLRFSNNLVINIELKSKLPEDTVLTKVNAQMKQNYYYLKSLGRQILIYTYVENAGLYKYDYENDQSHKIDITELIQNIDSQEVDLSINPDTLFVPSNYLISPFNNSDKFMNTEYFLTSNQDIIKKEIIKSVDKNEYNIFCISANAGTGKTLLMYDISKTILEKCKSTLIIHCGNLNSGHEILNNKHGWNIKCISSINKQSIDVLINEGISLILVDESQRIDLTQLNIIINKSKELKIPIVFSYDTKQFLKSGENTDIYDYITLKHINIPITKKKLTNKIRTNKEIASFIDNLKKIGKSNSYLNYENITIEYFEKIEDVKSYIEYLSCQKGWKPIKYTVSSYDREPLDHLCCISSINAHDVIGQEFDKVVFVMDQNFRYNGKDVLTANTQSHYYDPGGMLYQIVTRAVNQLKIIVLDNPELYYNLLRIKSLDKN